MQRPLSRILEDISEYLHGSSSLPESCQIKIAILEIGKNRYAIVDEELEVAWRTPSG